MASTSGIITTEPENSSNESRATPEDLKRKKSDAEHDGKTKEARPPQTKHKEYIGDVHGDDMPPSKKLRPDDRPCSMVGSKKKKKRPLIITKHSWQLYKAQREAEKAKAKAEREKEAEQREKAANRDRDDEAEAKANLERAEAAMEAAIQGEADAAQVVRMRTKELVEAQVAHELAKQQRRDKNSDAADQPSIRVPERQREEYYFRKYDLKNHRPLDQCPRQISRETFNSSEEIAKLSEGKGYMLIKVLPGHTLGRKEVPARCPPDDVPPSAFEEEGAISMPKTPKTQN